MNISLSLLVGAANACDFLKFCIIVYKYILLLFKYLSRARGKGLIPFLEIVLPSLSYIGLNDELALSLAVILNSQLNLSPSIFNPLKSCICLCDAVAYSLMLVIIKYH